MSDRIGVGAKAGCPSMAALPTSFDTAWNFVPSAAMARTGRFLLLLGFSRQFGANTPVEWEEVSRRPLCLWSDSRNHPVVQACRS